MLVGIYKGKYIGKTGVCGFVHGFEYEFKISNNGRIYQLYAYKDLTLDNEINLNISYASEISINRNWEISN